MSERQQTFLPFTIKALETYNIHTANLFTRGNSLKESSLKGNYKDRYTDFQTLLCPLVVGQTVSRTPKICPELFFSRMINLAFETLLQKLSQICIAASEQF